MPDLDLATLGDLSAEQLAALAAAATATLAEKLLAEGAREEDRIITVEEAGAITGLSPRYIRSHKGLPFIRQTVPNSPIRCSLRAARAWVVAQGRRRAG